MRHQFLGPRPQAAADVVAGDDEILAGLVDAADQQVDMRIVGVPVIDGDPVEPGAEVGLHLPARSRVKALRSVISAASSGETMNRK